MNIPVKPFSISIISVLLLALLLSTAVRSATITVNTTIDENNFSGDCSVREALSRIDLGNDGAGCVATGDVYGTDDAINLQNGVTYILSGGYLEANVSVIINGQGATIDGEYNDRVFFICPVGACGATVTVNDLIITKGSAVGDVGGGIYNNGILNVNNSTISTNIANSRAGIMNAGTVVLNNSTVSDNIAIGATPLFATGGGIGNCTLCTLTLINSTVSGNWALNTVNHGNGGGIYNSGTLILDNSTISGNTARNGGGIYNLNLGTVELTNGSTVSGNTSFGTGGGGGIYNLRSTLSISDSTIGPNNTSDWGGGIHDNEGVSITLSNSSVLDNTATSGGGGIYTRNGTFQISDTTISGNSADVSGGIYNNGGSLILSGITISGNTSVIDSGGGIYNSGILTLANSTLSGNTATLSNGGGIYNWGALTINNSTIINNTGANGGGIYHAFGSAIIKNTIIANNVPVSCVDDIGTLTSDGYNIESSTSCGFSSTGDITNTDPLLGVLADNGGPTQTHALLSGSPAIDAGNPAGCTWDDDNDPLTPEVVLTQDQRGIIRPLDGDGNGSAICDMGAYEVVLLQDIDVSDSIAPADDLQLAFSDVDTGNTNDQIITLSNLGGTDLQVTDVQISGADITDFSFDLMAGANPCGGLTIVVNGGGSCTVGVSFVPQSEGTKTANLVITSNDPDEALVSVVLSGMGLNSSPVLNGGTGTFDVAEDVAIGTVITTLTATDPDGDTLGYSITAGNDSSTFAIDPISGVITVGSSLDYETNPGFSLMVVADDGNGNVDTGTVIINVTDVDEGGGSAAPAGGGGGGCTIASNSPFDPLLPLMVGLALIYLVRQRCKQ